MRAALIALAALGFSSRLTAADRPNIVFIFSDDHAYQPISAYGSKHECHVAALITDVALDCLQNRDKSKPFLLMCQHKAPHREWAPPLRLLGHDRDRKYPEPDTLFDDYAGRGKAEHDQDMTLAK